MTPAYLRPIHLVLVFLGGALGVFAREALILAMPDIGRLPVAVLCANLLGALLLGALLEGLAQSEGETPRRQRARLLLGTGVLGGFTTYSALAQAVALFTLDGSGLLAFGYGLGTVVFGAVATWIGIVLGSLCSGADRARAAKAEAGDE